ncbi:MAG: hypothetical protein MUD07_05385 [Burkholderiaceae bacterium]|nr:hypothetical protein [Burkholderiaceae bacterium]
MMRTLRSSLVAIALAAAIAGCGSSNKALPDGSRIGTMSTGQLPEVSIDGKAMRLAPGARIYSTRTRPARCSRSGCCPPSAEPRFGAAAERTAVRCNGLNEHSPSRHRLYTGPRT